MKQTLCAALAITALAGIAIGCGGSDDKSTTTSASTATGASAPTPANIVAAAQATPELSTLVKAVGAAGLAGTLSSGGPYTVFAPTNAAFDALPPGQLDELLKPANKQKLADILTYHVVDGEYNATDLQNGQMVPTLQGGDLKITVKGGKVLVNGVQVETADVQTGNGIVHVIGGVLTPPSG